MRSILYVILLVLDLYIWLLIAAAVLSWLVAFNVVNARNQFVAMVGDFLFRITEPVLRPIRNMMPSLGGIDISPVIVILIIILIKDVIVRYIYPSCHLAAMPPPRPWTVAAGGLSVLVRLTPRGGVTPSTASSSAPMGNAYSRHEFAPPRSKARRMLRWSPCWPIPPASHRAMSRFSPARRRASSG